MFRKMGLNKLFEKSSINQLKLFVSPKSPLNSYRLVSNLSELRANLTLDSSTRSTLLNATISKRDLFTNPFSAFGENGKEIILLSTAFATMLLSTCFLLFILWFCCLAALKRRRYKNKLEKSIRETKANLSEMGIRLKEEKAAKSKKSDATSQALQVKDDEKSECLVLTTIISSRSSSPRAKVSVKKMDESKALPSTAHHEYDLVLDNERKAEKRLTNRHKANRTSKSKDSASRRLKMASTNKGFESEHDYYSDNAEEVQSIIGSNHSSQEQKHSQKDSPKEAQLANAAKFIPIERSEEGGKYLSIRNLSKLTKEQIEREFKEYSLQCQKRFNENFSDSQSSVTAYSSNDHYDSLALGKNGIYSHTYRLQNNSKVSEMLCAYANNGETFAAAGTFKLTNETSKPPKKSDKEQIWLI